MVFTNTACPDQQLFIKGKQNLWKVSLEDFNFYKAETVDLFTFTIEILNPLSVNPTKWPNGLKQFVRSVFDHFVKLALKGLMESLIFCAVCEWEMCYFGLRKILYYLHIHLKIKRGRSGGIWEGFYRYKNCKYAYFWYSLYLVHKQFYFILV